MSAYLTLYVYKHQESDKTAGFVVFSLELAH